MVRLISGSVSIDWARRWPDFKPWEIFSPETGGYDMYSFRNPNWQDYPAASLLNVEFLDQLQAFRNELGIPLTANRVAGWHMRRVLRSCAEQRLIMNKYPESGAAEFSLHTACRAADLTPGENDKSIDLEALRDAARKFGFGGIGFYKSAHFVHVDNRIKIVGGPVEWKVG